MTQTLDQRARELLAKHGGLPKGALAALTEALTRVEELEVIADFVITIGNIIQRSKISDEGPHSLRQSDGTVITGEAADMFGELADSVIAIARRATLTKGITE